LDQSGKTNYPSKKTQYRHLSSKAETAMPLFRRRFAAEVSVMRDDNPCTARWGILTSREPRKGN
jgi:hypothetical protein